MSRLPIRQNADADAASAPADVAQRDYERDLGPERHRVLDLLGAKVLLAVLCHMFRWVFLAAENVDERSIGVLGKVPRDQGRLDQLGQ